MVELGYKLFLVALLIFSTPAISNPFTVTDLFIDAKNFTGRSNDFVNSSINRNLKNELSLGLNVDFGPFYWENRIQGRTGCISQAQCQFDEVSYKFDLGLRLTNYLDLRYGHESRHALDNQFGYQIEDYIGFRINFIGSETKESLLR